jgi:ankyrin repeat protein
LKQERTIRDQLGKLPKDLKATYDEIYYSMPQSEREIADRAFQWVMCSNAPLTSEILLPAVCQDPEDDTTNPVDDLDQELLLEYCHNMLVIDPYRGVWVPSHLSVIEYLESHIWKPHEANRLVASVCLSILNDTSWYDSEDEWEQESVESTSMVLDYSFDLLRYYARQNWISHVRSCQYLGSNDRISNLLKRFLGSPMESGIGYQKWYDTLRYDGDHPRYQFIYPFATFQENYMPREIEPISSASYGICAFGLYDFLSDWFDIPWVEYRSKNSCCRSLLQLAAISGSHPICERLINWGVDVNEHLEDEDYGNALVAAVAQGHKKVVKLLIESGADVNAQVNAVSGNALAAAVSRDQPEVSQLLLDAKADPNYQITICTNRVYGIQGSTLITAVVLGYEESVKLLVKYGAEVNAQVEFGQFGSALVAASASISTKSLSLVRMLLEHGADVNMRVEFGDFGSALHAAIWRSVGKSESRVIELMLDNGADFTSEFRVGEGNALQFAKRCYCDAAIELLERFGAKWEPKDESDGKLNSRREAEVERYGNTWDFFPNLLAPNQLRSREGALDSFANPFVPNPSEYQGQRLENPIQNTEWRSKRRASL